MRTYCHPEILEIDKTWRLREQLLPLPGKKSGFPRISVIGNTSSGKTTLIRQLLGVDPDMKREEFLGITDSRSTVSNYEIIVDSSAEYYKAIITFYSEERINHVVDEILKNKVLNGIKFLIDEKKLKDILNINIVENAGTEEDKSSNDKNIIFINSLKEINKKTKEEIKEEIKKLLFNNNEDKLDMILETGEFHDLVTEYNEYLSDKTKNYQKIKRILNDLLKSANQNDRFDVTLGDPNWFRPKKKLNEEQEEKKEVLEDFLDKFIEFYKKFHEENIDWEESELVNDFKEYYLDLIKIRVNDILTSSDISPYIDVITYDEFEENQDNLNNLPFPANFDDDESDPYNIDIKEEWLSAVTVKMKNFNKFKEVLKVFTSLNSESFGKLLPSFVEGIRFSGKFTPDWIDYEEYPYNLVILDGEGAGQNPENPLPTHISDKFSISDLIVLADKANPALEQGTIGTIKKIITSGFSDNLLMTFSKLDLMQGDYLDDRSDKIWDAFRGLGSIKIGEKGKEKAISELDQQNITKLFEGSDKRSFPLYKLNKKISKITADESLNIEYDDESLQDEMRSEYNRLVKNIFDLANDSQTPANASIEFHNFNTFFTKFIEDTLSNYKDKFQEDLNNPTHWGSVKAFTRRVAEGYNNYSYTSSNGKFFDPLGVLNNKLQIEIRSFLDENVTVIGGDEQKIRFINDFMKEGMLNVNDIFLVEYFVRSFRAEWLDAYEEIGEGSNNRRKDKIMSIFDGAYELFKENLALIQDYIENKVEMLNKFEDC